MSTQTNRFGAAAHQSLVSPPRAHYDRGWESQPSGLQLGNRTQGMFCPRVVGEGSVWGGGMVRT